MQGKAKFAARGGFKALAAALGALALAFAATGWGLASQLDEAQARVSAAVQKAFYETCELTEAMGVNLRKLQVASEAGQIQRLLGEIARESQGASGNLAMLPMGEEAIASTIKFINQAGDFAETLSVRLASGGAIGDADYATIAALSERAAQFSGEMAALLERVERGEVALDGSSAAGVESLYPLSSPAGEYPTLLYDGPFSDGAQGGAFKALEGLETVSAEQAQANLAAFFDGAEDIRLVGEASAPVETYEFELTSHGYPISAGVTKQGGRVLYALSDADVTEARYTAEELLDTARAFLVERGFGPMEMSYYSRFDGILTVNYAAVQDGVTLYPDLVKVQVSMRDGTIVGLETGNYLRNHVARELPEPALTADEAAARLGAQLRSLSTRLCVIPVGSGEALCYEIRATDGADTFLSYIDAQTGAERELMQVVSDGGGTLVM